MAFSRIKTVAERYNCQPITIKRWATDPKYADMDFPKLVQLGPNMVGLDNDELDAYDAKLLAKRDAGNDAGAA